MRTILLALVFVTLATPALASDGVLEINQTCAQVGCFPGDISRFPVTIDGSAGHSYRLTSDLIVQNENTDGIVISTSGITIDLNGFEITRRGCENATTNCTPTTGTGSGVKSTTPVIPGLSVKNGSITGMGSHGVFLGDQAEVTNLRVRWNRLQGISVSTGSTVSGNTAYQNGNDGIDGSDGVTIIGNTSYSNGNATNPTIADGIECANGCLVRENSVSLNSGYGLNLGSLSGYRENVVFGNTTGTVIGGGVDVGANVINGVVTPTP